MELSASYVSMYGYTLTNSLLCYKWSLIFFLTNEIFSKALVFLVFLFAYIGHYVANAEICIYPALLGSVIHINLQTQSLSVCLFCTVSWLLCCIHEFVSAVVEHLRAPGDYPSASAVTSSSLTRAKTDKSCDSQMKENLCRDILLPQSQRFLMHIFEMYFFQGVYLMILSYSI